MKSSQILGKLAEIERSIGYVDSVALRRMVVEAQELVLQAQKETIQELRQKISPPEPTDLSRHRF
jgi:hypothetical protein